MADNKKRSTGKLLDRLSSQLSDLHQTTYHSTEINDKLMSQVSGELTDSIQKAIRSDGNYADLSNTTLLYGKLFSKNGGEGTQPLFPLTQLGQSTDGNIMELFQDNQMLSSLMETYSNSKWIKTLDEEIDMCLKYMPKLKTALNIKKDTVLCSDSFSNTFLNASQEHAIQSDEEDKFSSNIKSLFKDYELEKKAEEWYDDASTYGEQFIYIVPYKKALAELLNRKKLTNYAMKESVIFEHGEFTDKYRWNGYTNLNKKDATVNLESGDGGPVLKLSLNRTGLLAEPIEGVKIATDKLRENMCQSLYTEMMNEAKSDNYKKVQLQKSIDDELEYEDDATAADGLVGAKKENVNQNQIKVPGCVVKALDREDTIPLYIEDICLGYYHIQVKTDTTGDTNASSVAGTTNTISSMFGNAINQTKEDDGDNILKYIAGKISDNINTAFINSNQNLKKEIYMMLRYNDKYNRVVNTMNVNVTFIPPEDIVHIRFNEDPKTHRGRSDLWNGLIAAKMWVMLNSTSVIGNVTRGQDKRVYYVKTTVETNVAKTLMNVVSQIKKGNFGMRQMESINNILNIVGKFNDFVIPVGPSGDSPITFDIMQGQQFELPAELMSGLEESAVSSSGVPLEIVNSSTGIDFAIRYTMTNGRMLRDTLKRQIAYSQFLSTIVTKIYNCEYNDNTSVLIKLPPPTFLVITQGSQLIQNTTQYIDTLSEVYTAGKDDDYKMMFKQNLLSKYLPSYIDLDLINQTLREVDLKMSIENSRKALQGEEE